jgi:hypothetical protein
MFFFARYYQDHGDSKKKKSISGGLLWIVTLLPQYFVLREPNT